MGLQLSPRELIFTLLLTLVYLILVIGLTPAFSGGLGLYGFVPATLVSTGLIYLLGIYGRSFLGLASNPATSAGRRVARAGPPSYAGQTQPQSAPPTQSYQAPQPVQAVAASQAQGHVKFCMYCGRPMDARLQVCPNCNRGQ